jgi:hypothetical protein
LPANPPSWPIVTYPTTANGGTQSTPFNVPEHTNSMTVIAPALSGTWKLQTLSPVDGTTWSDTYVCSTTAASPAIAYQLSGFAQSIALVFPYNQFGGAQLRIVSSGAEGAARQWAVIFDRQG